MAARIATTQIVPGGAAEFERGDREHAERRDVAERHEHHPGDRKDQHEAEPRQQIDGSIGDAIEQQNDGDFSRHGDPAPCLVRLIH